MPHATVDSPFALSSLVRWLVARRPRQTYDYSSDRNCALAQYFRAKGFRDVAALPGLLTYAGGHHRIPPSFDFVAAQGPHTYGAALARARAAVA